MLGIGLLALASRALVLWQLHDHPLLQPSGVLDDAVYVGLARRVAAGDWALGPEAYFISPLYIYFLGLVFAPTGGSWLAARVVQVVLGAGAVLLVYGTARRWFGERAAAVAGVLAALTGVFAFYEILLLQSSIDPFLTALASYALTRALRADAPTAASPGGRQGCAPAGHASWCAAGAGAALALLALNRPNALPLVGVAAIGFAAVRRSRAGTLQGLALLLAAVVVIAPVTVRNRVVADDWVLIASHGGLNFYIGNNAAADGTYGAVEGITPTIEGQVRDARAVAERAVGRSLSPSEVSEHFRGLAWAWIVEHPGTAARLFVRKLAYVFNGADLALNYSYTYYSRDEPTALRVLFVGPWLLVPLGLLGLVAGWPREPRARAAQYAVWAALVPVYAVSVALFFVSTRYRLPLLVPLCIGAGAAVAWAEGAIRARRTRDLALAGAALAVLFVGTTWNVGPDTGRANERTEMIVRLVYAGELARAKALLARTEPSHPAPALLHFRTGRAHLDRERYEHAIAHLGRALTLDPGQPDISSFLGRALLAAGRPAEAVPHLEAALDAGVTPELAGYQLARALADLQRTSEARAALDRTVSATPAEADGPTWFALGVLAMRLDDPAYAERLLRRAIARAPELAAPHEHLGLALLAQGRGPESIGALARAVALAPAEPTAHYNLAVALAGEGRLAEARDHASRALQLRPDYHPAQVMLERLMHAR